MHVSGTELINPFKTLERVRIQPGWFVADMGCGALGHFVFPAAQMVGGNGRVYAVDLDKDVVRTIERVAKHEQIWNLYPVWSDIDVVGAARIPSESLDLVINANNFFLSQNRDGMIQECLRLLKPGGTLLIVEWKKEPSTLGPAVENRMSVAEIRAIVDRVGELRYYAEFEVGDHHDAVVYRRVSVEPQVEVLSQSFPQDLSA